MTVTFRAARPDDVAAVMDLLIEDRAPGAQPLRDDDPVQMYLAMIADGTTQLIVGRAGDDVVACYQLTILHLVSPSTPIRAQIESVRVRSDLRGQGIGAALIADAEDRARAADATLMQFTSNRARTDAHRFYERLGFKPTHAGFKKDLGSR
ncbi:MAG: GNAT family N-acetyltransferase [Pseudomonadota bacterium]|nr:GNAT family N-acetyltransferase [Pseudomonadota bacterium]